MQSVQGEYDVLGPLSSENRFTLDQELQARNTNIDEYEKEYLAQDLNQLRPENNTAATADDKLNNQHSYRAYKKTSIVPLEHSKRVSIVVNNQKARKPGVSFMSYFMVKQFVQKIRYNRTRLGTMNENHLKIINDSSSDIQGMLHSCDQIASSGFQMKNVSKLFQQEEATDNWRKDYIEKFNAYKKIIKLYLQRLPQIHPESENKNRWDFFITIIRLILLILIPLEICYQPYILFHQLQTLTSILILFLFLDILARMNTIFYINGQAIIKRTHILKVVFKQTLRYDLILLIGLVYFTVTQDENQVQQLSLLTVFGQFIYIDEVMQRNEESSHFTKPQKGVLSLIKLIVTLIYILHLFSCIWYLNASYSSDGWLSVKGLSQSTWSVQYLEAFYFAIVTMLTIGYGDNVPKAPSEKVIAIIFIMGACLWFSYSLNTIGHIINEITQNQMERSKKMRIINRYMHRRNLPYPLQYKIREYLNFRWKEEEEIDLEQEQGLLNELSNELKDDLERQSHQIFLSNCDFLLKNFSQEFLNSLAPFIQRKIISPQNTFSIYTDSSSYLCYIEQGLLSYYNDQKDNFNHMHRSSGFLDVQDFIIDNPKSQIYKAVGYVSLLVLQKQSFLKTIRQFPKDFEKYQQHKDLIIQAITPLKTHNLYCPACNLDTHSLQNCPQLSTVVDRELILKKYLYGRAQRRNSAYKRPPKRQGRTFQALSDKELAEQFAIHLQNKKPALIAKQLLNQLEYDEEIIYNRPGIERRTSIQVDNDIDPIETKVSPHVGLFKSDQMQDLNKKITASQQMKESRSPLPPYRNKRTSLLYQFTSLGLDMEKSQTINQIQMVGNYSEFNMLQKNNIDALYKKLQRHLEDEEVAPYINQQSIDQIQLLYLHVNIMIHNLQFETIKNFDNYFRHNNLNTILEGSSAQYHITIYQYSQKLLKFMYYPFDYVLRFQKMKNMKLLAEQYKSKSSKIVLKSYNKLVDLKNVLLKRKQQTRMTVKISHEE